MNALQREALRLITMQIAQLIEIADAAEDAACTARSRAVHAASSVASAILVSRAICITMRRSASLCIVFIAVSLSWNCHLLLA